jgi:hypothetical protein
MRVFRQRRLLVLLPRLRLLLRLFLPSYPITQ